MHLTGFFRVSWVVQLLVGVALFSVSFLIENLVLQAFFAAPLIALTLAIALELGKAAAIVWHRYLSLSEGERYPWQTRLFSAVFRIGLVGLSVLCSLLYLGVQLDRPNLAAVRSAELTAIDTRIQDGLQRMDTDHKARVEAGEVRRRAEYADTRREHQRQVDELETLLRTEMDNVVGGAFKGSRYQELQLRLAEARTARDTALTRLSMRQSGEATKHASRLSQELARGRQALTADCATARPWTASARALTGSWTRPKPAHGARPNGHGDSHHPEESKHATPRPYPLPAGARGTRSARGAYFHDNPGGPQPCEPPLGTAEPIS